MTYYQSNIPVDIVENQARVFDHLGIDLIQCLEDDLTHSQWLDRTFSAGEDLTVVCDIDAFPLNREAFIDFVERARAGSVIGLEQVANHLGKGDPYAGPMFLGCTRNAFKAAGQPSLAENSEMDAGQPLTYAAWANGVRVEMIAPQFAIQPKWPLGDRGIFGIGTFYGNLDFFHLFEARAATSVKLFAEVAEGTIRGCHDFGRYLKSVSPPKRKKRRFRWF